MKWLLALFPALLGLLLVLVIYLVLFRYVWMESGCFKWDPGSGWRPPGHCRRLSGVLKIVTVIGVGAALLIPLAMVGKRTR